jgi:hypothetical protein
MLLQNLLLYSSHTSFYKLRTIFEYQQSELLMSRGKFKAHTMLIFIDLLVIVWHASGVVAIFFKSFGNAWTKLKFVLQEQRERISNLKNLW